jgi:hypothetical protein
MKTAPKPAKNPTKAKKPMQNSKKKATPLPKTKKKSAPRKQKHTARMRHGATTKPRKPAASKNPAAKRKPAKQHAAAVIVSKKELVFDIAGSPLLRQHLVVRKSPAAILQGLQNAFPSSAFMKAADNVLITKTRDEKGNCGYEALLTTTANDIPSEEAVSCARLLAVAAVTERAIDQNYAAALQASTGLSTSIFLQRHIRSDLSSETYATSETLGALAQELGIACVLCCEKGSKAVPQVVGVEVDGPTAILFVSRREHIAPVYVSSKTHSPPATIPLDKGLDAKLKAKLDRLTLTAETSKGLPSSTVEFVTAMVARIREAAGQCA